MLLLLNAYAPPHANKPGTNAEPLYSRGQKYRDIAKRAEEEELIIMANLLLAQKRSIRGKRIRTL